jgi:hypothetical protein
MLRLGISLPLPVHEAAYGGNSLLGMADTHRVDVGLAGQHDRVPISRQSKLESVYGNKIKLSGAVIFDSRCALRQIMHDGQQQRTTFPSPRRPR